MNYSFKYYAGCPTDIDELVIKLEESKKIYLLEFLKEYDKNKKIVVHLIDCGLAYDTDLLIAAHQIHPVTIKIDMKVFEEVNVETFNTFLSILKKNDIPFFFSSVATNWSQLREIVEKFQPAEVYISGSLGFSTNRIRNYCKDRNVLIRAIVNNLGGQDELSDKNEFFYSTKTANDEITKFFVRPEDLIYYAFDVIEFDCPLDKQEIFRQIYKEGKWQNGLGLLLSNCEKLNKVKNNNLPPNFGDFRTNCEQKCKTKGNCSLCPIAITFAQQLTENSLTIVEK